MRAIAIQTIMQTIRMHLKALWFDLLLVEANLVQTKFVGYGQQFWGNSRVF